MRTWYVTENHHEVIAAWAKYRGQLDHAPRLLTLDHHTDTSRPFRNHINNIYGKNFDNYEAIASEWLSQIDFKQTKTVNQAIQRLSNDEHIITALKSNIISSALVIAHKARDTDIETYHEHKVICYSVGRNLTSQKLNKADYDKVIESFFLDQALSHFNHILSLANESSLLSQNYILDIDLDYFNTIKSIAPIDSNTIKKLINRAGLITVATEPNYVKNCAQDSGLESHHLLTSLQALIEAEVP